MNEADEAELDDLVQDFLARVQRGETVAVDAFAAAHPRQAEELRGLLPILLDMETYSRRRRGRAAPPDAAPPEIPGGDYRLLRVLGRGGMGVVWEALQVSLDRKVAVKVLQPPPQTAGGDHFVQEARIVAQLHHPNIVKVYGAGPCADPARYWYAMELVEGTECGRHAFVDTPDIVRAVEQTARALAYAHSCGVVHRDVKPANLILDAAGTVRVTDFGLAAVLTGQTADDDGARDGTLRYMAPERLEQGTCSFAADQYALGVTLWELVARHPVFTAASPRALAACVREGPVPPLAGVDADLAAIVAKATAHAPQDRYAELSAFADDLRRWLAHETVAAVRASPWRRFRLWTRRNPAAALGAAAALLCAFAFVGALLAGYVRTAAARDLAARNAALADAALDDVFHHMEAEPPSRRNAELMSGLLPYYGKLAASGNLPPGKTAAATEALGVCALRSGDYAQAETAFRRLCTRKPSARALNLLSETLLRRSNTDEANTLARRVADEYAASPVPEERFEAARALVALDHRQRATRYRRQAFDLVSALLEQAPDNSEYRFLHAMLLAETPQLETGGAQPFNHLAALAAEDPDRSDYALGFVRAVSRRLRMGKAAAPSADVLEAALQAADRLLGRQANVPDVVATVIAYREAFAAHLRRTGDNRRAGLERTRTSGMLEMLAHNPEAPDAARGRFKGTNGVEVAYRQITVGDHDAEPVTVVLYLHHRSFAGKDNALPLTSPPLRTLVTRAETSTGRTVVLVPQCPPNRLEGWVGAQRNRPDGLLGAVAELAAKTAAACGAASNRVVAVGAGSGVAACRSLAVRHPGAFARFLFADPMPNGLVLPPGAGRLSDAELTELLGEPAAQKLTNDD